MKAACTDGPSGLLAACPVFNINILHCNFFFFGGGQIKCLLACLLAYCHVTIITILSCNNNTAYSWTVMDSDRNGPERRSG